MSTMQSKILSMLEESCLPGLYKSLVKNLLPNMSQIQMENLFLVLSQERAKKQVLQTEMKKTFYRYSSVLDRLESNPEMYEKILDYMPPELKGKLSSLDDQLTKDDQQANSQLASLKSKIALQSIKKDI